MYRIIGEDGQEYGPADLQTIEQWIAEGRLNEGTSVIDPIYGTPRPAMQIPELQQAFQQRLQASYRPQNPPPTPGQMMAPPGQLQAPGHHYPRYGQAPEKSMLAGLLLWLFLGWAGAHRFYYGDVTGGVIMLILALVIGPMTCGIGWVVWAAWWVIDFFLILTKTIRRT
ncbi:MAG: TM2 domain-containing protein [Fimbriimonadaceae bacterium]|nr:TM2 domain-containing protein [Fimbriimonadaceae bacterium]